MASSVIPLRQSAVEASLKQAAFDGLPLPALCVNASAQVLAASATAGQLLGLEVDQLVGRHLSAVLGFARHRASARRWARLWAQLHERGAAQVVVRLPLANGTRPVLQIDATLLRFGQDTAAALTLRDISRERALQREQRLAQQQLAAVAVASDGIALWIGADRRVQAAQGNALDLPELAPSEVLGVPFELLLDETSAREFASVWSQSGQAPRQFVWRLRPRAGAVGRWVNVRVKDERQHPSLRALIVHARDVTHTVESRAVVDRLERRIRIFADSTSDLLMLVDAAGVVRYQSRAIRYSLGITPEATIGHPADELAMHDDRQRLRMLLAQVNAEASPARTHSALVRAVHSDGSLRRLWVTARNYAGEPSIGGLLVSARDVTAAAFGSGDGGGEQARRLEFRERLLELAMQARGDFDQSLTRLLRTATQTLHAGSVSFWRKQREGDRLRCEALFDSASDRFSRDWVGVELAPADDPAFFERLADRQPTVVPDTEALSHAPRFDLDARWASVRAVLAAPVLVEGQVLGVLVAHHPQPRAWDDDELNFIATAALMVALAMEGAQRQEAESRIEQLAWYDSLTGLPNRNLLRESMRDLIMTAANRKRRIAVMLIDLDRFKDVNDTLGHLVGDALIKSAAQVLRETVAEAGVVARLGGDEFVVLLNEFQHRQEVALLAARIAQALHRTDLVPNVDTQVSASIGVALFPEHGRDMSTLLKNADAAMYQAKRDGRNQFSFFNPIRYERAAREVQLGIQLLKALQAENAQFEIAYQPQVEMATGRVVGLEALIRWKHPAFGLLTPDRFIGVAEVSGLSDRITKWVLNEVCAQIARWQQALPGFDIPVAVNVAGREMGSTVLPVFVRDSLTKHAIDPHLVTLEITERTLVKESEINNDVLAELVALGVRLVLDDFGTGYSTLGYLKRMPIQALKIDQSFIEGIPDDADSRAIVHAMLAIARHFKLKVVAEGIENAEQVEYLRSIGCEYAQGYYYSRPLDADTIVGYVSGGAEEA